MELSIIVTAYNVRPYIEECLESLLRQGLKDYEIIVVNDSSTDFTQPVIDRYVANYEQIHSAITPGIGIGRARDYGLRYSKSDYFVFVDGSDYMTEGALSTMLKKIKKDKGDIVGCDIQYLANDRKESYDKKRAKNLAGDIKRNLILNDDRIAGKIIKRSFWNESMIRFSSIPYEELLVSLKTTILASRIDIIETPYYIGRQATDTITMKESNLKPSDIFSTLEEVYAFFSTSGLLVEYDEEIEYLFIKHLMFDGVECFFKQDEGAYREFMVQAFEMLKEYFPKYTNNRYIKKLLTRKQLFFLRHFNTLTMDLWYKRLHDEKEFIES